jgi:hypothetical protein
MRKMLKRILKKCCVFGLDLSGSDYIPVDGFRDYDTES